MSTTELSLPTFGSPITGVVSVPASKSQMIRALAAAALAPGRSHLYSASRSEDVDAMSRVLRTLGVSISRDSDPWTVDGTGGRLIVDRDTLDCGESGLTARIALALAASADGTSTVTGHGRLPERPMSGLISALVALGVPIDGDQLPLTVHGNGALWGGDVSVDVSTTTQFATALMMVAPLMHQELRLGLEELSGSYGYLDTTRSVLADFGVTAERTMTGYVVPNSGYTPTDVVVEADASAAVYPIALATLSRGRVEIPGLRPDSRQPDMRIIRVLESQGAEVESKGTGLVFDAERVELTGFDLDLSDAPDGALTLAVIALLADVPSRLRGLGSLRYKESDRLVTLATQLSSLGGVVEAHDDTVLIMPGPIAGGTIDPHGDHRIAMAISVLAGASVPITIKHPEVTAKTWPDYWQILDNLARNSAQRDASG